MLSKQNFLISILIILNLFLLTVIYRNQSDEKSIAADKFLPNELKNYENVFLTHKITVIARINPDNCGFCNHITMAEISRLYSTINNSLYIELLNGGGESISRFSEQFNIPKSIFVWREKPLFTTNDIFVFIGPFMAKHIDIENNNLPELEKLINQILNVYSFIQSESEVGLNFN